MKSALTPEQNSIRNHVRAAITVGRFKSVNAMAKETKIPLSSMQACMGERHPLSRNHWKRLASALQISVDELTGKREQNGHERLHAWQEAKASAELDAPEKGYDYTQTVEVPSKANGHTPHGNVVSELMLRFTVTGERRYIDAAKAILEMM